MSVTTEIEARLRRAASLPELLAASFAAFEVIRLAARSCEDRVPELLAAFMTTADAAVDGREAVTAAPSLTRAARSGVPAAAAVARTDVAEVTGSLAGLGALLTERLARGSVMAAAAGDRAACQDAAGAARRISDLMGRGEP